MKRSLLGCGAALAALTPWAAYAGSDNTLFNPTPEKEMRSMTTERPSKTDSPYSLDAGHFQVESNLFQSVHNDDCIGGTCTDTRQTYWGGSTNLRIGLLDNTDLQIISDLFRSVESKDKTTGDKSRHDGFGDTQVRLKVNLTGNDPSSKFSLGIIPYVKIPTNQDDLGNDRYEGGIGLPFNINFSDGWSLGGMTQYNLISDADGTGYDSAYANSLIVGKSITDKVSGYGEFYTYKADQQGAHCLNTADFGVIYAINSKLRVDANVAFGVSDAADDTNFFLGTAYRF
jgi:hypothetical protein